MGRPPQLELFETAPWAPQPPRLPQAATASAELVALGRGLPLPVRLGTSSWSFPGWTGLVYAEEASQLQLARAGLPAYARHPLLRTVGIDRTFYGPVAAETFAGWAEGVPDHFRFLAKAHEELTLGHFPHRSRYGARKGERNPRFLDASYATDAVVAPFVEGLGAKAGPLVFQFPPQDVVQLGGPRRFAERLHGFLAALPRGPLYAVEVRNAELLCGDYADALAATEAVPVLAAWGPLPDVQAQAQRTRARGAKPLVVRWMLHPGLGYEQARELYAPFHTLLQEDVCTRTAIAALAVDSFLEGREVYITINNKAEGSAPVSAERLARAVVQRLAAVGPAAGEAS
ncbi:MAG: DUF72 domain-containing protein [Myxococcaceae bacterium]